MAAAPYYTQPTAPPYDQYHDDIHLCACGRSESDLPAHDNGDLRSYLIKLLARAFRYLYSLLNYIIASLLRPYTRNSSRNNPNSIKPRSLQSTAYLDGVRGVASLFVFIHHYPMDYFHYLHDGYLAKPTDTWLLQLPFIRIVYSGRFMVGLFFVLSGYVLSYRPLQLIRDGNTSALLDSLASSVFRRAIRLFLPIIPSTFVVMILIHNGWYGSLDPVIKVPEIAPFSEQTMQWLRCLQMLINPLTWVPFHPKFSNQLWTLPVEFRGSMLVFVCLLGLSKAKTTVRMSVLSLFAFCCFYTATHKDMFLFISGIVLAELRHIQNTSSFILEDFLNNVKTPYLVKTAVRAFWSSIFIISWFLACWPDYYSDLSPGYVFLSSTTPSQFPGGGGRTHFWTSIAAVLMLLAFENNAVLQWPFTTHVAQYLGDISFALYIVHIPICYSVGRMITVEAINLTGMHFTGFMLGAAIVAPMVLWTADVYWRLVDAKSVKLAKWVWVKSCKSSV